MNMRIGTDIIEIARVARAIENANFLSKHYTKAEQTLIEKKGAATAAANFAGKEAVAKALGTGFSAGIKPSEIELLRAPSGEPYVRLYGAAQAMAQELGYTQLLVSLSHDKGHAVAMVVMNK